MLERCAASTLVPLAGLPHPALFPRGEGLIRGVERLPVYNL